MKKCNRKGNEPYFLGLVNANFSAKHVIGQYFSGSKRNLVQSPSCENQAYANENFEWSRTYM